MTISSTDGSDSVALPLLTFATLVLFYFVWAAMHDLAHGDEGTLEWTVLSICAVVMPLLYWFAVRALGSKARLAWLIGTGLLIGLFNAGGVASMMRPKYPKDPMLAMVGLAEGLPMFGVFAYRVLRELSMARRAGRPGV